LSGDRSQIERGLCRLGRRQTRRRRTRLADAARPHPQRTHQADEEPRLRQRLRIRPRNRRRFLRPELFPRQHGTPAILRTQRNRLRTRDREEAGLLGEAESEKVGRQYLTFTSPLWGGRRAKRSGWGTEFAIGPPPEKSFATLRICSTSPQGGGEVLLESAIAPASTSMVDTCNGEFLPPWHS